MYLRIHQFVLDLYSAGQYPQHWPTVGFSRFSRTVHVKSNTNVMLCGKVGHCTERYYIAYNVSHIMRILVDFSLSSVIRYSFQETNNSPENARNTTIGSLVKFFTIKSYSFGFY